jgi:hypothetical protein
VTHKQVYTYLAKQVEEVVLATLTVADGMYCFLDGFDENALTRATASASTGC